MESPMVAAHWACSQDKNESMASTWLVTSFLEDTCRLPLRANRSYSATCSQALDMVLRQVLP